MFVRVADNRTEVVQGRPAREETMRSQPALFVCVAALLSAGYAFAQDKPLVESSTTGSLTYGGKTHTVYAAAPVTSSRSIFKLKLADGSVILADRIPAGAKVLAETAVSSAPDASIVAQREREYWSARDREVNARLAKERDQEAQRQREVLLASQRELDSQQEVVVFRGSSRVRVNNSILPTAYSAYTSPSLVRSGIATYGGAR
jgi:hypothetical protein